MVKDILKKAWPHLVAIGIFLAIAMAYFQPALDGYSLKQHDINQFKGSSKEIRDYRELSGEEPLWTNSQFGGMPATQISVDYSNNLILRTHRGLMSMMPHPINVVFLYFIGFYIMLLCMRVNPWLSILGAIAFGLSSYFFIILGAGHNTKALAIAYMPPVIGGFYMAYRGRMILGAAIMTLFLTFQLSVNHPQVTYYMGFLLILMGIFELVKYIREKELMKFGKVTGILLIGVVLAILTNSGRLYMTQEYLKDSQRGPTELTEKALGKAGSDVQTGGLDLDYMTRWSYGKEETFSLVVPDTKGGASGAILADSELMQSEEFSQESKQLMYEMYQSRNVLINTYWGDQPGTSGPVYIGAGIMLLAIMAFFIAGDRIKWPLLIILVLAIFLSWGKNLMWLTEMFASAVPLYDSFRAVTIILIMVEFAVPLLAILGLRKVFKDRDELEEQMKLPGDKKLKKEHLLYGVAGLYGLVLLLFAIAPGAFFDFLSMQEKQMFAQNLPPAEAQKFSTLKTELINFRESVFSSDAWRSFAIAAGTFILVFLFIKKKIGQVPVIIGIGVITLIDLWGVDKRYLNNESPEQAQAGTEYQYWQPDIEKEIPYMASPADVAILQKEMQEKPEVADAVNKAISQSSDQADQGNPASAQRRMYAQAFGALNFETNYRVFELNGAFRGGLMSGAAFNSARASYFHKSIGGYSAIKLKRFNEFIQLVIPKDQAKLAQGLQQLSQIQATSNEQAVGQMKQILGQTLKNCSALNMLNTRYIIFDLNGQKGYYDPSTAKGMLSQEHAGLYNPHALGPAWLVRSIQVVETADEEVLQTMQIDPASVAVMDKRYDSKISGGSYSGQGEVSLNEYRPNYLKYGFNSSDDQFVVFSEVFYDRGWTAYIDGKEVPHVRVNYVLRGMEVPSGEHVIEFKFKLKSYENTGMLALAGSTLVLLLFAGAIYFDFKKKQS